MSGDEGLKLQRLAILGGIAIKEGKGSLRERHHTDQTHLGCIGGHRDRGFGNGSGFSPGSRLAIRIEDIPL